MYKRHLRNSKTTKTKNMRRHRNKNELIGALNKKESETESTIKER
jgi:hypothetical protein